ncbi:MAG: hypothetical protein AB8B91_15440 [Rubripirellula sp.]
MIHSKMKTYAVLFLAIATTFHGSPLHANPTNEQPNQALAAHGTIAGSKELVASLYEIYESEEKFVIQCFDRKDRPDRFSEKQISKAAGRLWKAKRDAEHLQLMAEPAGFDLGVKLNLLWVQVIGFGRSYGRTPKGQKTMQKIRTKFQRGQPALKRFLTQAEGAISQGKLETFGKAMQVKGIEVNEDLVFFSPVERQKMEAPFLRVLATGDERLRRERKQKYFDMAKEVVAKQASVAAEFSAEAKRISEEITTNGTATLTEGIKGGPVEAFAHVAKIWGNASASLTRASVIQWAFTGNTRGKLQPSPKQLEQLAIPALVSIVDAAATSTPAEKAQAVYSGILKEIATVERRGTRDSISMPCEAALAKLAAKDRNLPAQIESYHRATAAMLDWRESFARKQSQKLATQFPNPAALMTKPIEVEKHDRPSFARVPTKTSIAPPIFSEPANWTVFETGARLIGKPVSEKRMLRLTPTSKTAVVPHDGRHYANVPLPLPSETHVADLKSALVIDDTHGPLTIAAADAISSAELQDYLTVCGVVQKVHMEGAVTRFIGLPDVAYPLMTLGYAPTFVDQQPIVQQTCWRFDMMPMWAHNRYFNVIVPRK